MFPVSQFGVVFSVLEGIPYAEEHRLGFFITDIYLPGVIGLPPLHGKFLILFLILLLCTVNGLAKMAYWRILI